MSLYDKASLVFSGKAAAGKDGRAYNIKPVEKLKVDEYIENGGFDTDLVWIKNTHAGQEATISGGKGRLVGDGSAFTNLQQNDVFEADKVYKVSLEAEIREGELKVQSNGYDGNIGLISESGKHSFYFTGISGSPNLVLGRRGPNVDFDIEVDNVSVREVEQKAVDFTMVRGSNLTATRELPSGLIEKGRENLILQSNAFTTTWSTSNSPNITSGQLGYDGSLNAWKIELTANFGQILQTSLSVPTISTLSIFVKAGTAGFVRLRIDADTNAIADFDLSDGSVAHTEGNIIATKADSLGNGWFRVQMTSTTASGSVVRIYPAVAANDLSGTSGFIYIQDSQLEVGLAATPYIHTTDSYSKKTAGVLENEPRYDYSGGDATLLLEPLRRNLVSHSEGTFNLNLTSGVTEAYDFDEVSPTGFKEGVVEVGNLLAASGDRCNFTGPIISEDRGEDFTGSCYIKGTIGEKISYYIKRAPSSGAPANSPQTEITLNGEWQRISATFTSLSDSENAAFYLLKESTSTADSCYLWGYQIEKGSYATSYIPTYGSAATRKGDHAEIQDINAGTSYTVLFDFDGTSNELVNTILYFFFDDNDKASQSDAIFTPRWYKTDSNENDSFRIYDQRGLAYPITSAYTSTTKKWVMRVDGTSFDLFRDNAGTGQKITGAALSGTRFLQKIAIRPNRQLIKQLIIFDSALTDQECLSLTT